MNLVIKMIPADYGDSFIISFFGEDKKTYNILVDGGLQRTFHRYLKNELENIFDKGHFIDLLIITHIDQDHIGGIMALLEDENFSKDKIKCYWFNSGILLSNYFDNYTKTERELFLNDLSNQISVRQAVTVEGFLAKTGKWNKSVIKSNDKFNIGGATIIILSPDEESLRKINHQWQTEIDKLPNKKISNFQNDYSKSIDELVKNIFIEDKSLVNQSSIGFIFSYKEFNVLLAGDCHPSRIEDALKKLGYSSKNKLNLDFWKLSHHGSKGNTSDNLLSIIDCQNFLISTNGSKSNHPNKELLAKIIYSNFDKSQQINFYFNYDNSILREVFSKEEIKKYNINCIFPSDMTGQILKL